jgi:hypothetical protein
MTQEESHPDQEGHADNRRRRQSGQVTEQGTPLSGRPAGLPARTRPCSPPTLIGVTADEHWVIPRAPTYALLLIANQRPTAPSPLRGRDNFRRTEARTWAGRRESFPRPLNPPPGKRQNPAAHPKGPGPAAGHDGRADRGTGRSPARVPAGGPPGCRSQAGPGAGRRPIRVRPRTHREPLEVHPGCPLGPPPGAPRTPIRGCRPESGPAAGLREDRPRDRPPGLQRQSGRARRRRTTSAAPAAVAGSQT